MPRGGANCEIVRDFGVIRAVRKTSEAHHFVQIVAPQLKAAPLSEVRREIALQGGKREGAGRPEGTPNGVKKTFDDSENNQPDECKDDCLQSYGNSIDYTTARLRRDRPDLAERVESGQLSATLQARGDELHGCDSLAAIPRAWEAVL